MRVASEDAKDAHVSIEIGLSKDRDPSDATKLAKIVPQYKRDVNGNFELELTGAKIPIDENGKGLDEYSEEEIVAETGAMLLCLEFGIEKVEKDKDGIEIAYNPGRNMAWMIKALSGAVPPIDKN